jgi:tetratricopeptide (TPR) repeat protein
VATGGALLGEIFARRGLFGEALERFRASASLAPHDPEILLGEASALVALGRAEEAVAAAERLVALVPLRADALVVRARARQLIGNLTAALSDAEAAASLEPGRPDFLVLRGSILRQLGNAGAALEAFTAALELDPTLVRAWYERGAAEETLQHFGAARTAYQRALELLPTYLEAGLALADLLRRTGLTTQAIRLLADLLLTEPYAFGALVLLGRSLADENRLADALAAFSRVLRFHPEHTEALFHRGLVEARLRRFDAAIADWDRVVHADPTGPMAASARAQARSARELAHILQPAEA